MTRDPSTQRYAAQNRKARYDYEIGDSLEAGLVLTGSEVKSLRLGRCSIAEAFAAERDGDFWLMNAHFPEYESANRENHAPRRARKLLLKRREAKRLIGATERDGMTLIPLAIYFNDRGIAKCQIALARGKNRIDKRASIKERDWQRERRRLLKVRSA